MINVKGFRTITIQQMLDPKNEPNIKQYFVVDADGDVTNLFMAQSNAGTGTACLEQVFQYNTVSGVKSLQKIAWRDSTWAGAAWDI
jgi:hypothetical protein